MGLSARRASEIPWLRTALGDGARCQRLTRGRSRCATARPSPAKCSRSRTPTTGRARRSSPRARSPTAAARCAGASSRSPTSPSSTARTAQLQGALSELEASRQKIEAQNEELKGLANIDPLTGCLNRRAFFEQAELVLKKAREDGSPVCCVMTDIDKFKHFNDTYGHAVGDQVLVQVARVLKAALRPSDILCRYGGEEFCILLPGVDALRAAVVVRAHPLPRRGPGRPGHPLDTGSARHLELRPVVDGIRRGGPEDAHRRGRPGPLRREAGRPQQGRALRRDAAERAARSGG